jgi:hypothetical protein
MHLWDAMEALEGQFAEVVAGVGLRLRHHSRHRAEWNIPVPVSLKVLNHVQLLNNFEKGTMNLHNPY